MTLPRRTVAPARPPLSFQRNRFSTLTVGLAAAAALWAFFVPQNAYLWLLGVAALFAALTLINPVKVHPVIVWVIAFNWIGVVAEPLRADLNGAPLAEMALGPYSVRAYGYLLLALVLLATGIRAGQAFGLRAFRSPGKPERASDGGSERSFSISRLALAYFVSLVTFRLLEVVAYTVPGLQQPLLALFALKYVWIYLIAATVIQRGEGYPWLLLVIFSEFVIGITSFFSTYKEAVILTLIALAASGRRFTPRLWLFGVLALVLVTWVTLFWTAVKPEYRFWASRESGAQVLLRSFGERLRWMEDRFMAGNIRYGEAATKLVERLDVVPLYSLMLSRLESGYVPNLPSRLMSGVVHVLTPRMFFPSKEVINDSEVTTALTGLVINENTSISIGYVAEAYYDLGFPLLLGPVFLIGVLVGATSIYYLTRAGPRLMRESFMCANLFTAFNFGINFNKSLGVFVIDLIVLALLLKFVAPLLGRWLARAPIRRSRSRGGFAPPPPATPLTLAGPDRPDH